jgi:hypothetical protein
MLDTEGLSETSLHEIGLQTVTETRLMSKNMNFVDSKNCVDKLR